LPLDRSLWYRFLIFLEIKAMTKLHFLGYAGRYIRRLPISQKRILSATDDEVVYQSKDTRTQGALETRCTPARFVHLISQHVPDRYRHSMRYFGLLAPRTKRTTSAAIFLLLGQKQRSRPPAARMEELPAPRLSNRPASRYLGQTMHWVRSLRPGAA
jgi:Putative transposase